ncbi:MAG: methyltransferase domain-containing protein [Bacteroidales bacterium]|nr:methyltransferase domain-containing protein [Bacteroidales bacterium]
MSTFKFKRFEVVNERSSMKVNTDGVLLGAAVTIKDSPVNVLDIGTGTGTIALMLAQRLTDAGLNPNITGIDIDLPSIEEARLNFESSPWSSHLAAVHSPLQDFHTYNINKESFDLIVSNPPYFDDSLTAPEERRNVARHASVSAEGGSSLGWKDLLEFAKENLCKEGLLAMILPADQEKAVLRYGRFYGLLPSRILRIRTTERKPFKRIILEFSFERIDPIEETLIMMEKGKHTDEYISLVNDFYISLG